MSLNSNTKEFKSNFIGDFKIGDNIAYNFKIVSQLYSLYNSNKKEYSTILKPIIITNVSIIEAILFDFHKRVKLFTREGVFGLKQDVIEYIRNKKLDQFEVLIESIKKHKILTNEDESIYEDMQLLRKVRNRVHIQNAKNELEIDDFFVFSEERKILSEKILEKILSIFSKEYHRGEIKHVESFSLPWTPHFN